MGGRGPLDTAATSGGKATRMRAVRDFYSFAHAQHRQRHPDMRRAHAHRARRGVRATVGAPRMRCGWAAVLPAVAVGREERRELAVPRRGGQRRAGQGRRALRAGPSEPRFSGGGGRADGATS